MDKRFNYSIQNVLITICVLASLLLTIVFLLYFAQFSGSLSDDREIWAQFGDFVGGTANPILTFFTIIALLLTINLQFRQLQTSNEELRLTRNELEKTAHSAEKQAAHFETSELITDIRITVESADKQLENMQKLTAFWQSNPSSHAPIRLERLLNNQESAPKLASLLSNSHKVLESSEIDKWNPGIRFVSRTLELIYSQLLRLKNLEKYNSYYNFLKTKYETTFIILSYSGLVHWDISGIYGAELIKLELLLSEHKSL